MAPRHRIQCVNKIPRQDPHKSITNVGGVNANGSRWKQSQQLTVQEIDARTAEFYVLEGGQEVEVVVAVHGGNRYIKTAADGFGQNNLLSLPECP